MFSLCVSLCTCLLYFGRNKYLRYYEILQLIAIVNCFNIFNIQNFICLRMFVLHVFLKHSSLETSQLSRLYVYKKYHKILIKKKSIK